MSTSTSGSAEFDKLRAAFAQDPALRQETEWALRLAVETYNPSDRGLRFITGGIGEWIVTLAAYSAGLVTLPDGHNADGHDTAALLGETRALWSVKTSNSTAGNFRITNGQNGPGPGLIVPTIFLSPNLPGIVYIHPRLHPEMKAAVVFGKDSTTLSKKLIEGFAALHPECVIPLTMPVNPGAAVRDPGLEAVKLLVSGPQYQRLDMMFHDVAARSDTSVVTQLKELQHMHDSGALSQEDYQAAVRKVTAN